MAKVLKFPTKISEEKQTFLDLMKEIEESGKEFIPAFKRQEIRSELCGLDSIKHLDPDNQFNLSIYSDTLEKSMFLSINKNVFSATLISTKIELNSAETLIPVIYRESFVFSIDRDENNNHKITFNYYQKKIALFNDKADTKLIGYGDFEEPVSENEPDDTLTFGASNLINKKILIDVLDKRKVTNLDYESINDNLGFILFAIKEIIKGNVDEPTPSVVERHQQLKEQLMKKENEHDTTNNDSPTQIE